ncbi:rifin [Plasmodium falciparum IGH-CR14]|uniref:Rifin n=1 Tax=Plasmodium falciparum IGH-CR14 TaxID=580059 RepID=A0A0L1IAV2_PLAFA|nr:rifin [Plasmodium falciparum IGH-CR14]
MKIHYINILLFELPLNILIYNQRNHNSTTPHHPPNTRLLCECKLYSPANYDSDPEMKRVMQQFEDRTSQRFHEYDERMKTTRQKCKDKCDKEIQKIILKDKLEKQMVEQFSTLQTDIQNDAIPTCICEKSVADKVEKTCLKCGGVLGGGVTPAWGLISGIVYTGWKAAALAAAKSSAIAEGAMAGKAAGDAAGAAKVVELIELKFKVQNIAGEPLKSVFNVKNYADASLISESIETEYSRLGCGDFSTGMKNRICNFLYERMVATRVGEGVSSKDFIETTVEEVVEAAKATAETTKTQVAAAKTPTLEAKNIAAVEAATTPYYTPIIASIIAIEVIVLIMVIIYLILRYRRKKKMKKKLQYIKLLKE